MGTLGKKAQRTRNRRRRSRAGQTAHNASSVSLEALEERLLLAGSIDIPTPAPSRYDLGDAPDTYGTTLAQDGARHSPYVESGLWLGDTVDWELDATPNTSATGDDYDGHDEDGVVLPEFLRRGEEVAIEVHANGDGFLNVWVDFDGDGTFSEAWDHATTRWLTDGVHTDRVTIRVPDDAALGTTLARFRFSSEAILSYGGWAADGEVEDYSIFIMGAHDLDYGDAPDNYGTTLANGGASHVVCPEFFLGEAVDGERDGKPDGGALGDDGDRLADEDGVTPTSALVPGSYATIDVVLTATRQDTAYLDAWVDFDAPGTEGYGSWDRPDENVLSHAPLDPGINHLRFWVPEDAALGETFARFRLSQHDIPDGLPSDGAWGLGEVEDYQVTIENLDWGDAPDVDPGPWVWERTPADAAPWDAVGSAVSIFEDTAVVGAPGDNDGTGAVHVYRREGTGWITWVEQPELTPWDGEPGDGFGTAVSVHENWIMVGSPYDDHGSCADAGSVYAFQWDAHTETWELRSQLPGDDLHMTSGSLFGSSVAVEGDELIVGAPGRNRIYTFAFDAGSGWLSETTFGYGFADAFGQCVAMGADWAAAADPMDDDGVGDVHVYRRDHTGFTMWETLRAPAEAPGDYFGQSVSVFADTIIVGAPGRDEDAGIDTGAAYVFRLYDGPDVGRPTWRLEQQLTVSDAQAYDAFGHGVSIHGDYALVGAPGDGNTGSAYLYHLEDTLWVEQPKLDWVATGTTPGARLGHQVCLSGNQAVLGAPHHDWATTISGCAYLVRWDRTEPSYPTLMANNGARHTIVPGMYLGNGIDSESDGQPGELAQGDDVHASVGIAASDPDDEDGVLPAMAWGDVGGLVGGMVPGHEAQLMVIAAGEGYLNAWVDFNHDGDWDDEGEHIVPDALLNEPPDPEADDPRAVYAVPFQVPSLAVPTDDQWDVDPSSGRSGAYCRVRFSSVVGLGYDGPAPNGEVEDHRFPIFQGATIAGAVWEDTNANTLCAPWTDDDGRVHDEEGLSDVLVYLDYNRNGRYDVATELSTRTDAEGRYEFTSVCPAYPLTVRVENPGWPFTEPGWGVTSPASGYYERTVNWGDDWPGLNFGLFRKASGRGRLWDDMDGDGMWGGRESALPDWGMFLDLNRNGRFDQDTDRFAMTDSTGVFEFTDLAPGTYALGTVLPRGWVQESAETRLREFTVTSGQDLTDLDVGNTALPMPDLVGRIETVGWSTSTVPGDRVRVPLVVTNAGAAAAKGTMDIAFYVGTEQADGNATPVAVLRNQRINLAPGASKTYRTTITVPKDLLPGTYSLYARVDTNDTIEESDEDSNRAESQFDVFWRFGTFADRRNVRLTIEDANGTPTTFSLTGPGWAEVLGRDAQGFTGVTLTDTSNRSRMTIRTTGRDSRTAVGAITVGQDASLGALLARTTDLTGDLELGGQSTHRLTVDAGAIGQNVDLKFGGRLTRLRATGWAGGSIDVADVGIIDIRGGDFGANLRIDPARNPKGGFRLIRVTGGNYTGSINVPGHGGLIQVLADPRTGLGGNISSANPFGIGGNLRGVSARGGNVDLTLSVGGKTGRISSLADRFGNGGTITGTYRFGGGAQLVDTRGGDIDLAGLTVGAGGLVLRASEARRSDRTYQGGSVTVAGVLNVPGRTRIEARGGNVTLDTANISADTTLLAWSSRNRLGAGNVNVSTLLNLTGGRNHRVESRGGQVTLNNVIVVPTSVKLPPRLRVSASEARQADGTYAGGSVIVGTADVGGRLQMHSRGGNVTITSQLTVANDTRLSATASRTQANTGHVLGDLNITGGRTHRIEARGGDVVLRGLDVAQGHVWISAREARGGDGTYAGGSVTVGTADVGGRLQMHSRGGNVTITNQLTVANDTRLSATASRTQANTGHVAADLDITGGRTHRIETRGGDVVLRGLDVAQGHVWIYAREARGGDGAYAGGSVTVATMDVQGGRLTVDARGGNVNVTGTVADDTRLSSSASRFRADTGDITADLNLTGGRRHQITSRGGHVHFTRLNVAAAVGPRPADLRIAATETRLANRTYQGGGITFDGGTLNATTSIDARGGDIEVTALLRVVGEMRRLSATKGRDGGGGRLVSTYDGTVDLDIDGLLRALTAEKLMMNLGVDDLGRALLRGDLISATPGAGKGDHGALLVRNGSGSVRGNNQTIKSPAAVYTYAP